MTNPTQAISPSRVTWRGLGNWNLYFLAKLALLFGGYLNLQPLPNLVFMAFLLLPLSGRWLSLLRQLLAIPAAVALLYQDSWLPPFSRLLNQPSVMSFEGTYLLELASRFINWPLCGLLLIMTVVFIYLQPWLRFTTFSVLGLVWLAIPQLSTLTPSYQEGPQAQLATTTAGSEQELLDDYLQTFYQQQSRQVVDFTPAAEADAPFDLLILNICSLAWEDLDSVGLRDHALFGQMDVMFERFNSATSYSGPAAVRLLRASCGQTSHEALYQDSPAQCLLMDNLKDLGFSTELAMNHNGQFDDFLGDIERQGLAAPTASHAGMRYLLGFDGSPIARDSEVLHAWWQQDTPSQHTSSQQARVLYYNTTSLHDGNRRVLTDGGTQQASYQDRAQQLFADLEHFFRQLEQSGRPVVVLLVPEHGANLHGDRMQISGMRELPSLDLTHVPVGIKLFGMGHEFSPVTIKQPSSYQALSEFIARLYQQQTQAKSPPEISALVAGLPTTPWVAENAGTVVVVHDDIPYIRMEEQGTWLPYPSRFK